jgi:PAS domain-containing protein
MSFLELLPLTNSWPIADQARHFDLGCILDSAITDGIPPGTVGEVALRHAGCWECDLKDNSLIWSGGVYDIFGLPRGAQLTRDEAVALYAEESRAKMERLRAHAIRHRRGFTLDAEICPAVGGKRWMRLICAPVLEGDRAVRLHGLKLLV